MTDNKELVLLLSEAIAEQAMGNDIEAFDKVKVYMSKWSENAIQAFRERYFWAEGD